MFQNICQHNVCYARCKISSIILHFCSKDLRIPVFVKGYANQHVRVNITCQISYVAFLLRSLFFSRQIHLYVLLFQKVLGLSGNIPCYITMLNTRIQDNYLIIFVFGAIQRNSQLLFLISGGYFVDSIHIKPDMKPVFLHMIERITNLHFISGYDNILIKITFCTRYLHNNLIT